MWTSSVVGSFLGFVLFLALFLAVCPAWALSPQKPFTRYADQEDLTAVLSGFARDQGKNVTFTPAVTGSVSGRFEAVPATLFLNGMKSAFGVCWYEQGGALHFYHQSEMTQAILSSRVMSASALYNMLRTSSVLSPQLPVEVLPGDNMLLLKGPPAYIDQIRAAAAAFEEAQTSKFVMRVFSLKYAWAEDITVRSMDANITIPGIASILRAMVSGSPLSSQVTQIPSAQQSLGGQGMLAVGQAETSKTPQAVGGQASGNAGEQDGQIVNIIADPRVNAVLITDAEYRMAYYEKVIADLDKPVELVEIHAAIVDIDSNFQRELGVNFQGAYAPDKWGGGGDSSTADTSFRPLPTQGVQEGAGLTLSTVYTNGANFFLARIQALEGTGNARMLGRPSVLTMDNIQASLENITTYYVPVSGTSGDKALADLFKVEAGTVLKVTPHIIHNGTRPDGRPNESIKLVVSVTDDQNDDSGVSPETGALPPIKQTKINTQAIVGEGQSLLIGGYYYERVSDSETGVPGLMRIPLLGNLFKTKEKQSKRMERLILITPKVVRLDDLPAPPQRVDDPRFHQTPTQSHYEERIPSVETGSSCSRKVRVPEPVSVYGQPGAQPATGVVSPSPAPVVTRTSVAPAGAPAVNVPVTSTGRGTP